MNKVQIFSSPEFGTIKVFTIDNAPMFSARDLCFILDFKNPRVTPQAICDSKDFIYCGTITSIGKISENLVNENGLYAMVNDSPSQQIKEIKYWLLFEVLPFIYQHRQYLIPENIEVSLTTIDAVIKSTITFLEHQKSHNAICKDDFFEEITKENASQALSSLTQKRIIKCCSIKELAKILCNNDVWITHEKLLEWFWEKGYLHCNTELHNTPTQKAIDLGLFETIKQIEYCNDGSSIERTILKVTGAGQVGIVKQFFPYR